jgi:hypothetical protein
MNAGMPAHIEQRHALVIASLGERNPQIIGERCP